MLLLYTKTPRVFDQQNHRGQLECMKYTVPMCDEINVFITYSFLCHPDVKATKQSCQSMSIGETTPTDISSHYKNTHKALDANMSHHYQFAIGYQYHN